MNWKAEETFRFHGITDQSRPSQFRESEVKQPNSGRTFTRKPVDPCAICINKNKSYWAGAVDIWGLGRYHQRLGSSFSQLDLTIIYNPPLTANETKEDGRG